MFLKLKYTLLNTYKLLYIAYMISIYIITIHKYKYFFLTINI